MFYNVPMGRATIFALFGLMSANSFAADPDWIRIQSQNFEIYSTAGESSTRDTLKEFEQVRAFFVSTLPTKDNKPLPVRIIQFSTEKEYAPYRFNSFASAYYQSGAERDLIVMSHGGADSFPTAIHEYVHLVARHAGLDLPPWLNEGLADFYSTLRQIGNKAVIGEPIPGRLLEISREKWIPLNVVLAVDRSSPYYNEKSKAGMFYAESWALTHMLSLAPEYRPKWGDFVKAILQGKSSADALTSTYGRPVAQVEQDLRGYTRQPTYLAGTFDAKLEKIQQQYPASPAPEFDLKLMLLEIAVGNTKEQHEAQLRSLAAQDPSRPEPHVQLAYLIWGSGESSTQVRDLFAKAYSLGGRSPRMLWDYGRLILNAQPSDAVRIFEELSALEPERRDVKIELAGAMLNAGRAADAVNAVLDLKGCTPEEAVRCVSIASFAYLRLNQRDKAKEAAELYVKVAKTPEDKQRAQQVMEFLNPPAAPPPAPSRGGLSDSPAADADPNRPVIVRRPRVEEPAVVLPSAPPPLPSVTGKFVELVCGKSAELVIDTASGKKRFVIDDPGKILIRGKGSDTIDLSCGVQKPATVELGFAPAPAGSKADGALRTLRLIP
jgi:hypothetical protein